MAWFALLGAGLIGCGLAGLLLRRNLVSALVSTQSCFLGIQVLLAAFGLAHGAVDAEAAAQGRGAAALIAVMAGCQGVVGLAQLLPLHRARGHVDVTEAAELKW